MCKCSICKIPLSNVLMNNRWVCFKCDELLFDIEIESDQLEMSQPLQTAPNKRRETIPVLKPTGQK